MKIDQRTYQALMVVLGSGIVGVLLMVGLILMADASGRHRRDDTDRRLTVAEGSLTALQRELASLKVQQELTSDQAHRAEVRADLVYSRTPGLGFRVPAWSMRGVLALSDPDVRIYERAGGDRLEARFRFSSGSCSARTVRVTVVDLDGRELADETVYLDPATCGFDDIRLPTSAVGVREVIFR